MNKEAMQQQILEALTRKLTDSFHISVRKVLKTNVKLDGLTITKDGENIAPTIYMEPFYEALKNGTSLDDVINSILQIYSESAVPSAYYDLTSIHDFNNVKDRLYVELINRHSNQELLQDVPHDLFLDDFAVTVRYLVNASADEKSSFLVHSSHLNMWHIDQKTLLSIALENTRKLLGLDLRNMKDFIQELLPDAVPLMDNSPHAPMWVMTNKYKLSGAATALFDDILKDFAEIHGSFYVIFSSVHEVLLLLTPDNSDIDAITKINQEINAESVNPNEVLGTKAYYYCKSRGFILQDGKQYMN